MSCISWLRSFFSHPSPRRVAAVLPSRVVPQQTEAPAPAEPKFLLPETAEEFRGILRGIEAKFVAYRAAKATEAEKAAQEGRRLALEADRVPLDDGDPVRAEIDRRKVERLRNHSRNAYAHAIAARDCASAEDSSRWHFCRTGFQSREHAERLARDWERGVILEKGQVVHEACNLPTPASQITLTFDGRQDDWDRIERRVVRFADRFFLAQRRSRRSVNEGEEYEVYVGEFEGWELEFVTDSLPQFTDSELAAAVSTSD